MTVDWSEVQPVLGAVHKTLDSNGMTDSETVNPELGREDGDQATDTALAHLQRAGYLDGFRASGGIWHNIQLLPQGLEMVAGWPSRPGDDTYDSLIALLERRIEEAPSPEEKSRWEKLRDGILALGRDVFVEWLAKGLPH